MFDWEGNSQAFQAREIKIGDRIAIKRMKGKGKTGIKIFHIGIVKGMILETNKVVCTVDWVATNLERDIADSRGCRKAVNGPFEKDQWDIYFLI